MSLRPVRLSELALRENGGTPAPENSRNSRGSRIPVNRKRSMSSEPKSATKIIPTVRVHEEPLRRSKSTAMLCQTPMQTPVRMTINSAQSRPKTPTSLTALRKQTNRPPLDKVWLTTESNALQQYLARNMLNECIPKGPLRSMSVKQFVSIIQHFVMFLTNNRIKITMANYVDEVQRLMKIFEYQGQVTRSILISPNTMHSWPNALALLSWMRATCEHITRKTIRVCKDFDENNKMHIRTEAMYKMYALWNLGKEIEAEEVLEECVNNCVENPDEDTAKLDDIIAAKKKNIERMLNAVQQAKKVYEEHEDKRKAFVQGRQNLIKLEEERQDNMNKIDCCKKKCEAQLCFNEELQKTRKALDIQVKTQPINEEEKIAIDLKIAEMNREIDNDKKIILSITEANYGIEMELNKLKSSLDKVYVEYNCLIYKFEECFPIIGLNNYDLNNLKLAPVDLEDGKKSEKFRVAETTLDNLAREFIDKIKRREEEFGERLAVARKFMDDILSKKAQIIDMKNSIKSVEEKMSKQRLEYDHMQSLFEAKISATTKHIEELREEISGIARYEEMENAVMYRFRQSKRHVEKLLEKSRNMKAKMTNDFEKKLKYDREQLLSLHASLVQTNNEMCSFIEMFKSKVDQLEKHS